MKYSGHVPRTSIYTRRPPTLTKRKTRRIVIAKNVNAYVIRKKHDICHSGRRNNIVPYRALQLQSFGQCSLYGAHQLTNLGVDMQVKQSNFIDRNIRSFLSLSYFCFVFVFAVLGVIVVVVRGCKSVAGRNCLEGTKGL